MPTSLVRRSVVAADFPVQQIAVRLPSGSPCLNGLRCPRPRHRLATGHGFGMTIHESEVRLQSMSADSHLGWLVGAPSEGKVVGSVRPVRVGDVADIPAPVGITLAVTGGRPKFKDSDSVAGRSKFSKPFRPRFPINRVGGISVKPESCRALRTIVPTIALEVGEGVTDGEAEGSVAVITGNGVAGAFPDSIVAKLGSEHVLSAKRPFDALRHPPTSDTVEEFIVVLSILGLSYRHIA